MNSQVNKAESVSLEGYGWLIFAGVVLAIAGVMRIFDGIWAFRYDGVVPDDLESAVLGTSLSTYGWVWIIVGMVLVASSFAIANRSQFARWIGIIASGILTITAVWWIPYYPVWSLAYIFIGLLVLYALAVHGGRESPHV